MPQFNRYPNNATAPVSPDELGLTPMNAGEILFASSSTAIDTASNLTWDDTEKKFLVKGKAGQTADLFEVQNSSSTVLFQIDERGGMHLVESANSSMLSKSIYYNTNIGSFGFVNATGQDKYLLYKSTTSFTNGDVLAWSEKGELTYPATYGGSFMFEASSSIGGPAVRTSSFGFTIENNFDFYIDGANDSDGLLLWAPESNFKLRSNNAFIFYAEGLIGSSDQIFHLNARSSESDKITVIIDRIKAMESDYLQFKDTDDVIWSLFDKFAAWHPPSIDNSSAQNNSIYYSTDDSRLVYKDSGGGINPLY